MTIHTKKKLSLHKETLRDLTADQIALVAGGNAFGTRFRCAEPTGVAGHCEQASRAGGCGPAPRRQDHSVLQHRSLSYCLDKPPMSGRTLPPTARD